MGLKELGWNEFFEKHFNEITAKDIFPARVATAQREKYWIYGAFGELKAEISGKYRYNAALSLGFPVVGDWVTVRLSPEGSLAIIENILPRSNKFSRKAPGETIEEQVLAANIDTAFIVNGLDNDYNPRRIERYLALAAENGIKPVILLNKSDICPDITEKTCEIKSISRGFPVIALSALKNKGIKNLKKYIKKGSTTAFLGSSGAGKSTIINCLLGEERLETGAVRESDSRGRHVTSRRELIILPGGGLVIDNPGLREIQLWAGEEALEQTFSDITGLASGCKFKDCSHTYEPGCAVQQALETGSLDPGRYQSFLKLGKEIKYLASRKVKIKSLNERIIKERKISILSKQIEKHKRNYGF